MYHQYDLVNKAERFVYVCVCVLVELVIYFFFI